jgi:hypothetical protein
MTRSTFKYNYYIESRDEAASHYDCNISAMDLFELVGQEAYTAFIDTLPEGATWAVWAAKIREEFERVSHERGR